MADDVVMETYYARKGDVKMMCWYLDKTPIGNDERFDYNGHNALHAAVDRNQIECVQILLKYSFDINKKSKEMNPIRDWNSKQKRISRRASAWPAQTWPAPDYSTIQTALHIACRKNHSAIAKLLLKNHADPNILDDRSLTPLCAALLCDSADCVNVLLDFGVRLGYAASVAALKKNVDALKKMTLRYPFEDFWFPYRKTDKAVILDPLSSAASMGHVESIQVLLDFSAKAGKDVVNVKGFAGKTPVMYARCTEGLKLLLKHGADVNVTCGCSKVALYYYLYQRDEDFSLLAMERTDLEKLKRVKGQGGVLVQAICQHMIGIAKKLLENGFRVGVDAYCKIRERSYTPLMAAIEAKDEELVGMVLQRGANMNRWFSMNPVTRMIDRGHEKLAWRVIDAGFDVNTVGFDGHCEEYYESYYLHEMSEGSVRVLELFLKAGVRRVSDLAMYYMISWSKKVHRNTKLAQLVWKYGRQRDRIKFRKGQEEYFWGEVTDGWVTLQGEVSSLKDLCRLEVRHSLMDSGKHSSMFKVDIGGLGLPKRLQDYILHVAI